MPKDIRNVALSWRQAFAVLLIIAALILMFAASVHQDGDPAEIASLRMRLWIAFTFCAVASALLFYWQHRIVSQPDIHPDILAQLVGAEQAFELDTIHFWASGHQFGSQVRIIVILQNVYADKCTGQIRLVRVGSNSRDAKSNLPIDFELGAGEVFAIWRDLPLPVPAIKEISFRINGSIRKVKAARVRFKRRTAIQKETPAALVAAGLLVGHLHYSSGSRLTIPLAPDSPDASSESEATAWETMSLWSPEEPRDIQAVKQLVGALFKNPKDQDQPAQTAAERSQQVSSKLAQVDPELLAGVLGAAPLAAMAARFPSHEALLNFYANAVAQTYSLATFDAAHCEICGRQQPAASWVIIVWLAHVRWRPKAIFLIVLLLPLVLLAVATHLHLLLGSWANRIRIRDFVGFQTVHPICQQCTKKLKYRELLHSAGMVLAGFVLLTSILGLAVAGAVLVAGLFGGAGLRPADVRETGPWFLLACGLWIAIYWVSRRLSVLIQLPVKLRHIAKPPFHHYCHERRVSSRLTEPIVYYPPL